MILNLIALSLSMNPFTYIWAIRDGVLYELDIMHKKPYHWASAKWFMPVISINWVLRVGTYSIASVFYIWCIAHQYSILERLETKKEQLRFYLPKIVPLVFYLILRIIGLAGLRIFPSLLPFTTLIGLICNFSRFGVWYLPPIIFTALMTGIETFFVVAIIRQIRKTSQILQRCNYIQTRTKQVGFRFFVWSTVIYYALMTVFDMVCRVVLPDYVAISAWLSETKAHFFTTQGMLGRDLLMVSHAIVTGTLITSTSDTSIYIQLLTL